MPKFKNSDYAPPHVHTCYSVFDGQADVGKLAHKAREMGFPAIACTDHGSIAGVIKFINECGKMKAKDGSPLLIPGTTTPLPPIKPMIGMEGYLCKDHTLKTTKDQPDGRKGNRHLILLAKNWEGYQNLCRLSETSWINGFFHSPRIDLNLLAEHSKSLICSSACLSSVINHNLLHDRYDKAKMAATLLKDIFNEDFFLEVMYHGIDAEASIIPDVLKLGSQLDIPVICSNDTHYIEKKHARSQEVLMAMSTSKCILDPTRYNFPYDEFYLKSAEEMGKIFGHYPNLLYNTLALAERINDKDIVKNFGGMRLPKFKIPPEFKTLSEYMNHLAQDGMKRLNWDNSPKHVAALKKEITDLHVAKDNNNYDFFNYLLIVWDSIKYARDENILVGYGRGSGYGSVLLRALRITYGPDPIEAGCFWERFLGFDEEVFVQPQDFYKLIGTKAVAEVLSTDDVDLEEERDVEDDLGGIDRY